jgi:two-component system response regulator
MTAPPIVLVEDDDDHAELTEMALRRARVPGKVVRARTGAAALELICGAGPGRLPEPPALVLLDLRLPDLDGRTVLERLRAAGVAASLRVVVLTASHPDDVPALEGVAAVLTKPVRPGVLAELAARLGLREEAGA